MEMQEYWARVAELREELTQPEYHVVDAKCGRITTAAKEAACRLLADGRVRLAKPQEVTAYKQQQAEEAEAIEGRRMETAQTLTLPKEMRDFMAGIVDAGRGAKQRAKEKQPAT